jgi:hypothetical protein
MKDWKMIVISATLAFMLSFIFGIFGSVSLGILLIRAFSGAIIFAAMAFGATILQRRYLPELYELQADIMSEIEGDSSEVHVKQSIPGHSDSLSVSKPRIDISIDDEDESFTVEMKPENDTGSTGSFEKRNDLVDEISESDDTVSSTENEQVPANIDVLPDMGVFSNSFEGELDEYVDAAGKAGAVTLDIMGEEQDPELVVRAVRTMVKKDQEG